MILSTAWKNVWRNRTRSLVVIISVTIGIFAGAFGSGLMTGTMNQRLDAALNEELAHIHINQPDFNVNYDIDLTLDDTEKLNASILEMEGVIGVANRKVISAMANTSAKSMGVQLIGINPEQEKSILALDKTIIEGTGSYFEESSRTKLAFIGQDLAKELNIIRYRIEKPTLDSLRKREVPEEVIQKLEVFLGQRFPSQKAFTKEMKATLSASDSRKYGRAILEEAWHFRKRSKMTVTFLDSEKVQTGGMFRIAGIYDVNNSLFEKANVFVLNSDLSALASMEEDGYHQTIVKLNDPEKSGAVSEKISKTFSKLEVRDWKTLAPDIAMMHDMVGIFHLVFMIIILAALSFGIVNTMLMVVLERTKELGMLTAIGMNKKKVFTMIMSESIFLSLVGGVCGMIISKILISVAAVKGINFAQAAEGFEAMGFSAHIYPEISASFFISLTILIIITGILSAIYPALKALRLDPADALRTE